MGMLDDILNSIRNSAAPDKPGGSLAVPGSQVSKANRPTRPVGHGQIVAG
jgi:hypothetical protein